ncbi:MAG: hypothetical protein SF051_03645 [Elusimicrobiota bacterium]|nr:hypothetical protein [Elusimicrobiota bacterium]
MKATAAALLLALAPARALAAGTTAGATLRRPVSARAAAMADALTALPAATDAFGANPAGLVATRPEVRTLFSHGSVEDSYGFMGSVVPWRGVSLAGGLAYYDAGRIDIVSATGARETRSAQRDMIGSLGAAAPLGAGLTAGGLARFYRFELGGEARATGAALDAGLRWDAPVRGLSFGAALQNAGPGVKYEVESDPLPLTMRGGAAWTTDLPAPAESSMVYSGYRLTVAADAVQTRDERLRGGVGAEFGLDFGEATSVMLRGGWKLGSETDFITAGVGIREKRFFMDYALGARHDLGAVHHVALGARF